MLEMPKFDYKTEVLTSVVGRDKLRVEDLDRTLSNTARTVGSSSPWPSQISGGMRDGHLLVFKRERAS
jgi:hypothetical protein